MKKYFDILGLSENASQEEIKKAYKKRALSTHPDQGGDQEEFLKVQEAFDVLSGKKQAQQTQVPFDAGDFFSGKMHFDGWHGFSQQSREEPRPPSNDIDVRLTLQTNIEEVKNGKSYSIEYNKSVDCTKCEGKGGNKVDVCTICNGNGLLTRIIELVPGFTVAQNITCNSCNGRGKIFIDPCEPCHTKGYTLKKERLSFKLETIKEK